MLSSETLSAFNRSDLPTKWRPKYLGLFAILEVLGPVTYRIELPPSMIRSHNVFHVSKLKKYITREGDDEPLDIVIDAEGTVEQEVYKILDENREGQKIFYLALFVGDTESEAIQLPKKELKNCKDIIIEYEESTRTSDFKERANVTE